MKKNYYAKALALTVAASMVSVPAFAAEGTDDPQAQEEMVEQDEQKGEKSAEEDEIVAEEGTKAKPWNVSAEGEENTVTAYLEENADNTYTLTVEGKGKMADYTAYKETPWYAKLKASNKTIMANNFELANITKIVVKDGVTRIGDYAFAYTAVTDVQLEEGIQEIGVSAFRLDFNLKHITIPASVTNMHHYIDEETGELTYYEPFDGTFNLETISVAEGSPYKVVQGVLIGQTANEDDWIMLMCPDNLDGGNTTAITKEGFPENTTIIGPTAFGGCRNLESIEVPDAITEIGGSSFMKCYSLKSFSVPVGVTKIQNGAFNGCSSLETFDLNNVTELGDSVFTTATATELDGSNHACDKLTTLDLSKVTKIGTSAFSSTGLTSVKIAEGTEIGYFAFFGCENLKSVEFEGDYTVIPYEKEGPTQGATKVFINCPNLETMTFADNSVVDIPKGFFENCTSLKTLDLSKVTLKNGKIGEGAFRNCSSLETLSLPTSGSYTIEGSAFTGSQLKDIVIPDAVTNIRKNAFASTSKLETVTMSKDFSDCFSSVAISNKEGYKISLRWYVGKDWISVVGDYLNKPEVKHPIKFDFTPVYFFDVHYGDTDKRTRFVYRAKDMKLLQGTLESYTKNTLGITVPEGKKFAGWTTSADGTEIVAIDQEALAANPVPTSSEIRLYPYFVNEAVQVISGDLFDKTPVKYTYGDENIAFAVKLAEGKTLPKGLTLEDFTVKYIDKKGKEVTSFDAGAYDAVISYAGNDSYAAFSLTVKDAVTVVKATPKIIISPSVTAQRGAGTVTLTVTKPETATGAVTVKCDNGITVDEKDGVYTAALPNATRTYTFTASYAGDNNYNVAKDATCTVDVTRKKSSSSSSDTSAPTYGVSTGKTENGEISVTPAKAEAGETVTIKATPDSGYQLDKMTVKDKNNSTVKLKKVDDNEYTFTMPVGKVSVDATFVQKDAADDSNAAEAGKTIKLQIGSRIVNVDNEAVIYDAAPVIRNDRTLVPIRIITEALGGKVDWNGATKEVTLSINDKEIKMTIGKTLEKYGVAPVIIDGRTFVPVRFVADELGAEVAWDEATKTVTIKTAR